MHWYTWCISWIPSLSSSSSPSSSNVPTKSHSTTWKSSLWLTCCGLHRVLDSPQGFWLCASCTARCPCTFFISMIVMLMLMIPWILWLHGFCNFKEFFYLKDFVILRILWFEGFCDLENSNNRFFCRFFSSTAVAVSPLRNNDELGHHLHNNDEANMP